MLVPALALMASLTLLGASISGMLRGMEPFATWFYPLAWYPTLVALDAMARIRTGRWTLLGSPRLALALLAWSIPFWLFFELVNLRLANWYYVFLPDRGWVRWTGVLLSFATVLPAILMSRRILEAWRAFSEVRWRPLPVLPLVPPLLQVGGILFLALALARPTWFFPLVWGAVTMLVDPWVYRRDRRRSLLGALERGRPAVILQLLAGGLVIGFLWETYNFGARGKWIYTVPGLEELKLFEMPLLGFLGFPVLSLDGWAVWNALVLAGLAPSSLDSPRDQDTPRQGSPGRRLGIWLLVAVLSGVAAFGMERQTITSTTPRLTDVVGGAAPALDAAGHDVFSLARAAPRDVAPVGGVEEAAAEAWVERARLATLRGLGSERARELEDLGIRTVEDLATADPVALSSALETLPGPRVPQARVRVWVRGAQSTR